MTRRDLIALLGTAAAAWPVRGSAQQGERVRRVGALTNLADHSRMFALLLIVTGATGAIDAVSILHFQAFAAFVTATIVLLGAEMVGQAHTGVAKPIVLVAFFVGAILGGRLMRRRKPTERLFAESLCVTAALILAVALISAALGVDSPPVRWTTIALVAFAMGSQTSATRQANVPDMVLPQMVTLVWHGLAYDSRLGGGRGERTLRRLGIVLAVLLGAAGGATLSAYAVWPGLLLAAALLALAGTLGLRTTTESAPPGLVPDSQELGGQVSRLVQLLSHVAGSEGGANVRICSAAFVMTKWSKLWWALVVSGCECAHTSEIWLGSAGFWQHQTALDCA